MLGLRKLTAKRAARLVAEAPSGGILVLIRQMTISVDAARALLTSLSLEAAKELARHQGSLSPDRRTTLSPEVAKALAAHQRLVFLNDEPARLFAVTPKLERPTAGSDAESFDWR